MKRTAWIVAVALALGAGSANTAVAGPKYKLLRLDGRIVKWGAAKLGAPAHVTYAFADAAVQDTRARNCKAIGSFETLARTSGLSVTAIERQAEEAFSLWQSVAGITFSRATSPETADIVIGAQIEPRGYAFANVRYRHGETVEGAKDAQAGDRGLNADGEPGAPGEARRSGAVVEIEKSAICLNPEHTWKIGTHDGREGYDLRFTFTHEIGHAIGLDHYNRHGQIMHFKYTEEIDRPQFGDLVGIRKLYGMPVSEVARK